MSGARRMREQVGPPVPCQLKPLSATLAASEPVHCVHLYRWFPRKCYFRVGNVDLNLDLLTGMLIVLQGVHLTLQLFRDTDVMTTPVLATQARVPP